MRTRGVVYVHSAPPALAAHVEWALARVLGSAVRLEWSAQPYDPGLSRAECSWSGRAGTGAQLAAALRGWPMLRFEVTEEPSAGSDGERFMHVPGRGLFRGATGAHGDLTITEGQVGAALAAAHGGEAILHALEGLLGTAWDAELEPYRRGGDGAPATRLTQVS